MGIHHRLWELKEEILSFSTQVVYVHFFLPYSTLPVTRTTLFVVNYYLVEISHSTFFPALIDNPRFKRMCKKLGLHPLTSFKMLGNIMWAYSPSFFKNFAQLPGRKRAWPAYRRLGREGFSAGAKRRFCVAPWMARCGSVMPSAKAVSNCR